MQLSAPLNAAEQAAAKAGVRLTTKRKNVLALLMATGKPLSAYELADLYKVQLEQAIPPMSVYRMLDFLTENNLAHKLSSENKFIGCAHANCEHSHGIPQFLICERCNQVKEIAINKDVFNELENAVTDAGFTLIKPQLELKCLCDACSKLTRTNT